MLLQRIRFYNASVGFSLADQEIILLHSLHTGGGTFILLPRISTVCAHRTEVWIRDEAATRRVFHKMPLQDADFLRIL